MPAGTMDRAALAVLEEAYDVEHEKTYGHRAGSDEPVEFVTLKVIGHGVPDVPRAALAATAELPERVVIAQPLCRAYFGPTHGWCDTAIINRSDLREPRAGPCIIEECDSTASCRPARPRTSTVWKYLYRCACDPALNLNLIPKIKREGPRVRIPLPPVVSACLKVSAVNHRQQRTAFASDTGRSA